MNGFPRNFALTEGFNVPQKHISMESKTFIQYKQQIKVKYLDFTNIFELKIS